MHRIRRLAATLLGLLVLQVSFLGLGGACPVTATIAPAAERATAHHGEHGTQQHDARQHESPDRAPAHCQTAVACAMAGLAASVATLDVAGSTVATTIVARDDAAPASFGGAPEPPPPRA